MCFLHSRLFVGFLKIKITFSLGQAGLVVQSSIHTRYNMPVMGPYPEWTEALD